MIKRMIFHIPMKIDVNLYSGSQIRPQRMIQAFKDIGFEVDVVMGYCKERNKLISQIKKNIKNGVKYSFLYSETSTMPTALTESHHLPICPFMDFNFFRFCRKNGIKIGLFYRDIYWKLDSYKIQVPVIKRLVSEFFYRYDLKKYDKLLNVLYLPTKQMYDHLPIAFNQKVDSLPPAIEIKKDVELSERLGYTLGFIYVGGIGDLYDISLFVKEMNSRKNILLNICTREKEWVLARNSYKDLTHVRVHHKNGKELDELYSKCTIAVYFIKPNVLWTFAMGVKLFEYIGQKKPIIAVKGTAVGDFVEKNSIGWVIDYDENELRGLIEHIQSSPEEVDQRVRNMEKIIPLNTWEARARVVEKELSI